MLWTNVSLFLWEIEKRGITICANLKQKYTSAHKMGVSKSAISKVHTVQTKKAKYTYLPRTGYWKIEKNRGRMFCFWLKRDKLVLAKTEAREVKLTVCNSFKRQEKLPCKRHSLSRILPKTKIVSTLFL